MKARDGRDFDHIYTLARKEREGEPAAAIKEHYEDLAAISKSGYQRLLNWLRFQPVLTMAKVVGALCLLMFVLALASRLLKPHWGAWVELIYLLPTAVIQVLFLIYMVLSVCLEDRASANITVSERRWLTSLLIVEEWSALKLKLEELLPTFRESTRRLERRRKFVRRGVAVAQTVITFFDFFVGQYLAPLQVMHTYFGVPQKYSAFIFIGLFALMYVAALVLIYVPLYWRKQLEPFLVRAIERQRELSGENC